MANQHNYGFNEEELNRAIAASLSIQKEDEELRRAIELSLQIGEGKSTYTSKKSDFSDILKNTSVSTADLAKKICENHDKIFKKYDSRRKEYKSLPEKLKASFNPEPTDCKTENLLIDALAESFIEKWFTDRKSDGCTKFIVSIGSKQYKSQEQCKPAFAKDRDDVAILNIDPSFSSEKFKKSSSSRITKMRFSFDSENFVKGYSKLMLKMNEIRNEKGCRVALMDFTSPLGFMEFGRSKIFCEMVGSEDNKFIYGQFYSDKYPCAILNKQFFQEYEKTLSDKEKTGKRWRPDMYSLENPSKQFVEKIGDPIIAKIWKLPRGKDIPDNASLYQQSEIDKIVEKNNLSKYGKFFAGLKHITMDDIFPQRAEEKEEEKSSPRPSFQQNLTSSRAASSRGKY